MKDEIKKMIDNLDFISKQESATIEINQNGCKLLLDYITNLQEENERLKERYQLEKEDYNSRNKKAIEYIGNGNIGIPRKTRNKFIAILKGEDKDE